MQFNGRTTSLRVDLSLREDVLVGSEIKPVLHFYNAFSDVFKVPVMSLEEIMAEKIRAILYTKHPRHLHDVWYLNDHGVKLNPDMIRTKIKTVYGDEFDIDKFRDGVAEKRNDWINDLRPLLPNDPPDFDSVSQKVLEIVTNTMK